MKISQVSSGSVNWLLEKVAARSKAFISFIAAEHPALMGKPSDGCSNDQSSRPSDRNPTDPVTGSGSYDDYLGWNLPARSRVRGTEARRAATGIARPPYACLRVLVGAQRRLLRGNSISHEFCNLGNRAVGRVGSRVRCLLRDRSSNLDCRLVARGRGVGALAFAGILSFVGHADEGTNPSSLFLWSRHSESVFSEGSPGLRSSRSLVCARAYCEPIFRLGNSLFFGGGRARSDWGLEILVLSNYFASWRIRNGSFSFGRLATELPEYTKEFFTLDAAANLSLARRASTPLDQASQTHWPLC